MPRIALTLMFVVACSQGQAKAELITHTFGFPTIVGPDIPTTFLTHTVSGADADFKFDLAISSASGTPVHRGGSGGLGVTSVGETFTTIDHPGEDLTFALTVSVSNVNPNGGGRISAEALTFGDVTIKWAGGPGPDFDSGTFGAFSTPVLVPRTFPGTRTATLGQPVRPWLTFQA